MRTLVASIAFDARMSFPSFFFLFYFILFYPIFDRFLIECIPDRPDRDPETIGRLADSISPIFLHRSIPFSRQCGNFLLRPISLANTISLDVENKESLEIYC